MGGGEAQALVTTKLTPPTLPSELVVRRRLDDVLDAAATDPLVRVVLVSAPAGSGKSTLLAAWQRQRADGAWLQSDPADRDPARFWGHVVGALDRLHPGLGAAVRPAVTSSAVDALPLIERLANELATSPPTTLVIDDYHLIDNQRIDEAIERFIELVPEHVLLILGTRVDPGVRLSRLRVRSQLVEVRADDLAFAEGEAGQLLADERLSDHHTLALRDRTEGWAAGLVLARLSLQRSDDHDGFVAAFQGDDRLVVDYLTDEYLAGVDAPTRRRLLESAVLGQMTGSLLDAVSGTDDGERWLRELAATNQLVIGLDHAGTTYRYHHLLRDLLLLEAEREIPERIPELHLAAARWYQDRGDTYRSIDHFIHGGDLVTAGGLIAVHATELINEGQVTTVQDLLGRLGDLPERHAPTAATEGWINLSTGRFAAARRSYDAAVRHTDGTAANLIAALGIMVNLAEADLAAASTIAETMTEPTESTQAIGLSAVHTWAGRLDEATHFIAVAREFGASEPSDYSASVAPGFAAVVALESADPAEAARHAQAGLDIADDRGIPGVPQLAVSHAVIAHTTADPALRAAASARAIELARIAPEPFASAYAFALVADVGLEQGDADAAALLAEAQRIVGACPDPGIAGRLVARVASRHGQASRPEPSPGLVEELTDRELAVLRYLPSPMSQREIASELFVSLNTVKTHCRAIFRKLAVSDRKAAVQAARDAGLL